ncbi:MAG TPA: hypothetical protein VIT21_03635 [Chthoniobacterales bacterium]
MSAETQDRPLAYEEEYGKPTPSKNHGYIQANLIGEFIDQYFEHGIKSVWIVSPPLHTIQILSADGGEQTLNAGIATDPATGLTADLAVVFS